MNDKKADLDFAKSMLKITVDNIRRSEKTLKDLYRNKVRWEEKIRKLKNER